MIGELKDFLIKKDPEFNNEGFDKLLNDLDIYEVVAEKDRDRAAFGWEKEDDKDRGWSDVVIDGESHSDAIAFPVELDNQECG